MDDYVLNLVKSMLPTLCQICGQPFIDELPLFDGKQLVHSACYTKLDIEKECAYDESCKQCIHPVCKNYKRGG